MDIKIERTKTAKLLRHWPWAAAGAVAAGLLAWLAAGNFTATLKVDRRALNIGEVSNALFNDYVSLDGQVAPIQVVQISPEEGGIVTERLVEEGAQVRKGDVLVRLSNSGLDLQILNAESELAEKQNMLRNTQISMEQDRLNNSNEELQLKMDVQRKQRQYAQQQRLYDERLNSKEECLKAKEDYELAQQRHALIQQRLAQDSKFRAAQVEQMTDNLDNMRRNVLLVRRRKEQLDIRSHIDGEVGLLDVEMGQNVAPGQKIGVINDLSDYKVTAKVDEHYIDRVHPGLEANFEQNGKRHVLKVHKVYPEVREGRFKVDFVFAGARPGNIRTGQTYYLDLQLGASKMACLIPKGTFYSVTGGNWIFVLGKDGRKAYRRNIRIGRQNPRYYEVLDGLEPGEQVIISGYEAYKDNEILVLQ